MNRSPVAAVEEGRPSYAALTKLYVRLQASGSSKLTYLDATCQNDFRVVEP